MKNIFSNGTAIFVITKTKGIDTERVKNKCFHTKAKYYGTIHPKNKWQKSVKIGQDQSFSVK